MATYTADRDFTYVVRVTSAIIMMTLIIGLPMFVSEMRTYGLVPAIPALLGLPAFINHALFAVCFGSLGWLFIQPTRRAPALIAFACFFCMGLQDITRWAAFLYMYWGIILAAAFSNKNRFIGTDAIRIIICGVYFWAGFHKANALFFMVLFPWFIEPLHTFSTTHPSSLDAFFQVGMFLTPYFEAVIGIMLLFTKWRRLASSMALVMLVTVLYCLGPTGHNWAPIVWPWNVWLFMLECRLFLNPDYNREYPSLLSSVKARSSPTSWACVLVFVLMPFTACYSLWYTPFGFKLYSANIAFAQVFFPPGEKLTKAPEHIKILVKKEGKLDLIHWAVGEIHSLPYPVPYSFKLAGSALCPYLDQPKKATLRISYPPPFYTIVQDHEDVPLCP